MPDTINTIDLTGSDPEFKRSDRRFMVFTATQTIDFTEPAYANTIKVFKLGGTGEAQEMYENTDWAHRVSLKAINAISDAKLREPTFSSNLVTGIVITRALLPGEEFQISVEYQGFYRELTDYPDEATGPAVTPGLVLAMLQDIDFLKNVKNPVADVTTETLANIRVLDEDYTGLNEENHIFNEEHNVNVPNNKYVIRPANGSFYKHDLTLTYDGTTLVENRDYVVRGVNHGKTRVSSHNSGVYEYIIITAAIVGVVKVSYRAFGGEITAKDMYSLRDGLIDIVQMITNGNFVTVENLPSMPIIIEMLKRLTVVEESLRHYAEMAFLYTINQFVYNGQTHSTDNWVDVASVAHGAWSESNPIPTLGTGDFRLHINDLDYNCDFTLTYNLGGDTPKVEVSKVEVHGTTYLNNGIDHFLTRIVPKFRIVYDKTNINHGFILQMSIVGKANTTTQVVFYDRTGSSTIWSLLNSGGEEHTNTEMGTTLPDGTAWVPANGVTNEVSILDGEGYTVWAGSLPVSFIEAASYRIGDLNDNGDDEPLQVEGAGLTVNHLISNVSIDLAQVKGMRVRLFDRFKNIDVVEESTQLTNINGKIEPIAMYYIHDLCAINCELQDAPSQVTVSGKSRKLNKYTLVLKSKSGTNSLISERFDLKQVDLLF